LEKAIEVADESGEQIENDTDGVVNPEQTNEEVEPQSVEESSESVQAPSPTDEEDMLPNESEKEGEDVDKLDASSSPEASIPKMNETEEPKAV
jgi:DNA-binding transcriptional regulator YdaS (Cro superfamily)